MSPRLLNSSRAAPAVAKATTAADSKETSTTPPRFSKPMTSGESGSTCLTSSPSPRVRNSESRGGTDAPATSNGGGHSWEGRRGGSNGGADESAATPRRFGGDDSGLPRTSIWTGFDSPPHASNKRALQRRKCDFKIIVVFRGGWCTSSGNLLKGFVELNPLIKRAGGKVVALSSQSSEQVAITSREMGLPFQAFGDPTNCLVDEMNARFDMGCKVCLNDIVTDAYPHGMAQPCVLAVRADDAQDKTSVLYKWDRWQTIGSLRHGEAWTTILQAFNNKSGHSLPDGPAAPSSARPSLGSALPPPSIGRAALLSTPQRSRQTSLESSAPAGRGGAAGRGGGGLQRVPSARAPTRGSGGEGGGGAGGGGGGGGGEGRFGGRFSQRTMPRPNTIDETAEDAGAGGAAGVAAWAQAGIAEEEDEDAEVEASQLWQPRRGGDTPFRPARHGAAAAAAIAAGEQRQLVPSRQGGARGGGMLRGWGSLRAGLSHPPSSQGTTPGNVYASSPGERPVQVPGPRGAAAVDREGGVSSRWGGGGRPGGGAPRPRGGQPAATVAAPEQQQPWRWKQEEEQPPRPRRQSTGAAALPPQHRTVQSSGGGGGGGGSGDNGERQQQQQQQQQASPSAAVPQKAQPQRRRLWSLRSSKGVASFHEADSDASRGGGGRALPQPPSSPSRRAVFR